MQQLLFSAILFGKFPSPQTLCSEQRSTGLLEVKLIFQHTGHKKVMSVGDELRRRIERTEVVTSAKKTLLKPGNRIFHLSNKQSRKPIWCSGHYEFPL